MLSIPHNASKRPIERKFVTDLQTMDTAIAVPASAQIRNPSCTLCRRRKIKCDRIFPCSGCVRAGVECVPVIRSKLPRGRRGGREPRANGVLLERIIKLESLVKNIEAQDERLLEKDQANRANDFDDPRREGEYTTVPGKPSTEPLNKYLGTPFWVTLSQEISGLREVLDNSSNDEDDVEDDHDSAPNSSAQWEQQHTSHSGFLISSNPSIPIIVRPTRHQMYIFCDSYLANVDPVFKVLHAPSLRKHLQEGSTELDCSPGPGGLDALRFSIYYAATISMSDGECRHRIGEDRHLLLARYRAATELALAQADFVNTVELSTLQALAIYLVRLNFNVSRMCADCVGNRSLYVHTIVAVLCGHS